MPEKSVVETINHLLAEWASPRIPAYMQGRQVALEMPMSCSAVEAKKTVPAKDLPSDLAEFWNSFFSVTLFQDVNFGQWGLRLLDYEKSNQRTREFNRDRSRDAGRGDRIIGEFIGDLEQLLIRCDRSDDDFGHILVALPASPRHEFYKVADNFSSFLEEYRLHEGQKYWEPQFLQRRGESQGNTAT